MNIKCYHISPARNRASILDNGLLPKSKIEGLIQYEPRIFFSTDLSNLGFDFVGSTQKFIANRYNTTEANLYNWMKRHNLKKS